jgi:diguanylate cyclase (GGDEF)-like protein
VADAPSEGSTAGERSASADRLAAEDDQRATARDGAADARDLVAVPDTLAASRSAAVEGRRFAADDRRSSAHDRLRAARDRAQAGTDRDEAAHRRDAAGASGATELEALRRVATAVAQDVGATALFELVAEQSARMLELDFGGVVRFEGHGQATILGSWAQEGVAFPAGPVALDGTNVSSLVAASGRPGRVDAYAEGTWRSGDVGRPPAAAVGAPVTVAGALWGAVVVGTVGERPLSPDCEPRLERFASLVATAISNAHAWEALERQAATDPLTGLPNHRTFHERLGVEIARATRYDRELSVVVFDLDEFKRVNDELGHPAGDAVLAEAARRLAGQARTGELVGRVGGEEFAWLMPETDGGAALVAAERARTAFDAKAFGPAGRVTVSAGVCSLRDSGSAGTLMARADVALYRAKDAGRNATRRWAPAA